jgi:RNA polymerase sigma factor (sigma-70 family)
MPLSDGALYACYRRIEKPLYNVLYRQLWQAQDCQDLIHDAFMRIWAKRDQVDEARVENLIWTTALNLARNRLRWRGLWRFGDVDSAGMAADDPSLEAERYQRDAQLRRALKSLPRAMREVLLLSEFGGLGVAEISSALRIPPGTAASRKHNALARLRAVLENYQ